MNASERSEKTEGTNNLFQNEPVSKAYRMFRKLRAGDESETTILSIARLNKTIAAMMTLLDQTSGHSDCEAENRSR